ncbi:MAG: BamA/TamA family outer membrane protein [Bacteroidales bacterium]|nr:BamA/TamA family outer membrane protein [Bacteroidales bacterium]
MKTGKLIKFSIPFFTFFFAINFTLDAQVMSNLDTIKKVTVAAHPILGYTPETSLMFGLGGFIFLPNKSNYLSNPGTEINQINPFFIYSLKNQIRFVTTSQFYLNRNYIDARLELSKFPDYYYGIGNFTDSKHEIYNQKIFRFTTSYMRRITYHLQTGIIFEVGNIVNDEIIEGGQLESDSAYVPIDVTNFGIGPALLIDKRNNAINPRTGFYLHTYYLYRPEFINDIAFQRYYFDIRKYFPLKSQKSTLALQFKTTLLFGETVPLYYLTHLGGESRLRGILANRYIDHKMAFIQAEYRQMISKSFGLVVFSGTGRVSREISDFDLKYIRYCIGSGIRFVLLNNPAFRFRADFGYGTDNQTGIYVGLYEVF